MWNYRIIRREDSFEGEVIPYYKIHSVYFNEDLNIHSWSKVEQHPHGDSVDELKGDIYYMLKAFDLPTLIEKDGKLIEYKETL